LPTGVIVDASVLAGNGPAGTGDGRLLAARAIMGATAGVAARAAIGMSSRKAATLSTNCRWRANKRIVILLVSLIPPLFGVFDVKSGWPKTRLADILER